MADLCAIAMHKDYQNEEVEEVYGLLLSTTDICTQFFFLSSPELCRLLQRMLLLLLPLLWMTTLLEVNRVECDWVSEWVKWSDYVLCQMSTAAWHCSVAVYSRSLAWGTLSFPSLPPIHFTSFLTAGNYTSVISNLVKPWPPSLTLDRTSWVCVFF